MKYRLLTVLRALKDPRTSESWTLWATLGLKVLTTLIPPLTTLLDGFANAVSGTDFSTFLTAALVYVTARLTSKAAKAHVA